LSRERKLLLACFWISSIIVTAAIAYVVGLVAGSTDENHLIAFSWGDSIEYRQAAFYGAEVYFENSHSEKGVDVFVKIEIGPDGDQVQMPQLVGHAANSEEARVKWRKIEWTKDALLIGEGPDRYVMPRTIFESHR
jgi:hypothetical protein